MNLDIDLIFEGGKCSIVSFLAKLVLRLNELLKFDSFGGWSSCITEGSYKNNLMILVEIFVIVRMIRCWLDCYWWLGDFPWLIETWIIWKVDFSYLVVRYSNGTMKGFNELSGKKIGWILRIKKDLNMYVYIGLILE